jgi:hypothetical protein
MARRSFRDRFFTPRVARAILSPLGIVLFGAGTAAGVLAGLGFVAPLVGVVAWGARVLAAVPRGSAATVDLDPYVLSEPWKNYVIQAQSAKARFDRTVAGTRPGPLRDRLQELSARLEDGLVDCWHVAVRGDQVDDALRHLDAATARLELAELLREAGGRPLTDTQQARRASLESQLASFERMQRVSAETQERLRLIDARLDELVARSVEVSVGAGDAGALGDDMEDLVLELEALRQAQDETQHAAQPTTSLPPPPVERPAPAAGPDRGDETGRATRPST